jgi:hypothetical protein
MPVRTAQLWPYSYHRCADGAIEFACGNINGGKCRSVETPVPATGKSVCDAKMQRINIQRCINWCARLGTRNHRGKTKRSINTTIRTTTASAICDGVMMMIKKQMAELTSLAF